MTDQLEPRRYWFQFSLRTLLLAVALVAIFRVALKFAGPVWWTTLAAGTFLLFMASAVVALVDRGPRQALAVGLVTCMASYGLLLAMAPKDGSPRPESRELDPYEGNLPTTKILYPLFRLIVVDKWIDYSTGKEIPNYNPALPNGGLPTGSGQPAAAGANPFYGGGGLFGSGVGGPRVSHSESPDRRDFMLVGHLLWMLLFGYVGVLFARFVYRRRVAADHARRRDRQCVS